MMTANCEALIPCLRVPQAAPASRPHGSYPSRSSPSAYEERLPDRHADPGALAIQFAREKALDVAARRPLAVVIGADTIVALGPPVVRKARRCGRRCWDARRAVGADPPGPDRRHRGGSGRAASHPLLLRVYDVHFRALEEPEVRAYVADRRAHGTRQERNGIQGWGALLIEGIRGDYPNVMGLPLASLALMLRDLGFPILGLPPP